MACNWFRSGRKRQQEKAQQPATVPPVVVSPPVPPVGSVQPIRVTDERDGELLNRGYSYWSACHIEADGRVLLFVGHTDGRPKFFRADLKVGLIERLGAMLGYGGTGEGWYFQRDGYVMLCDGPKLRRVDPVTGDDNVVMDISTLRPGCRLWQAHSSDDSLTHSATVEEITNDGPYMRLGTVASRRGELMLFPSVGDLNNPHRGLDESHLDASGQFLVIEESHDNRIIDMATREERRITNAGGALSHMDCGEGFAVGEDDQRGACTWLDLRTLERRVLFETWNQGVISVKGGRCIVSGQQSIGLVALDGSGVKPIAAHGMVGSGYDFMVRANLDPTGRVAMWLSNAAERLDAYVAPV